MKKTLLIILAFMALSCSRNDFNHVEAFEGIVADLASPEFAGRSLYQDGELRAANYIVEKFNEFCTSDFVEKPCFQQFSYPLNTTAEIFSLQ